MSARLSIIRAVCLGASLLGASTADAQDRVSWPTRPPMQPPADVPSEPQDSGFAAWRSAGAGGRVLAPFVILGGRYEVLVQSAVARERPDLGELLERAVAECAPSFDLAEAERQQLVDGRAWREFVAAVANRPLVAITIVPAAARPVDCARGPGTSQALLEHGIRFGRDTIAHPSNDAASVELWVGNTRVTPSLMGRAPVVKIAPDGFLGTDGLHLLRVYVDLAALAPSGTESPTVQLRVSNLIDLDPAVITIPRAHIQELWREILPWRARRLATHAVMSPDLPVTLPEPHDAELREARRSYLAGAYVDASALVLARLNNERLRASDRTTAELQIGLTFAGLGDAAAARVVIRNALDREPCLRLPESAPVAFQALLDEVRPSYRCEPVAPVEVLRLGLIPGRAHKRLAPERPDAGFIPMALTATVALASVVLHLKADQLRRDYEREIHNPIGAFEKARDAHVIANQVGALTYAVWGATVVEAVLSERRRGQRTAAVRDYGASATPRVSIAPAARGLGLSVTFF